MGGQVGADRRKTVGQEPDVVAHGFELDVRVPTILDEPFAEFNAQFVAQLPDLASQRLLQRVEALAKLGDRFSSLDVHVRAPSILPSSPQKARYDRGVLVQ